MPPKKNGSTGGSGTGRGRGRPAKTPTPDAAESLSVHAQTTISQPMPSTPAANTTQTMPPATTGRRTRTRAALLEDTLDDPERILRAARTPSRRASIASNERRESGQGARPSVAASFNADLWAIGEEDDGDEDILADADVALPSIERPRWIGQGLENFGEDMPSPRREASRSTSLRVGSPDASRRRNTSSLLSDGRSSPDVDNPTSRRWSGVSVDASSDEDFTDNDSIPDDRRAVRQPSASPLFQAIRRTSRAPSRRPTPQPARMPNEPPTTLLEGQGQAPHPGDSDDPGAEEDLPREWIQWLWMLLFIFWEQFGEAMRYFKQARCYVSFGLTIKLLASILCSAGPICNDRSGYELILIYLRSAPWECFCILGVYTLTISGLIDSFEAIGRTLSNTGIRAAQQEEPLFKDWNGLRRDPMAFIHGYLAPICRDVVNEVLEPVLVLGLTMGLRHCSWLTFGMSTNVSEVVLAFTVSFSLHCLKWACQTLGIFYNLSGNVRGLRWVNRPLVSLLLVTLSVLAISRNWAVLSPSPVLSVRAGKAYLNSYEYARTGNATTLSIASWISQSTKEAATQVYRVTQVLVTGGVVPTMGGVS